MFDRVKDEISWDEGVDISPKYLGDDMVLLLSLTDARAEQMGKEETMNGSSLFHSLEKWNSRMRIGYRLIWVQCLGILLLAWDIVQIQKIVAAIGEMVEVDDDVEEAQRLDRARVLIKTPW